MRRFTRLTNAFSKKFENYCHALGLYLVFDNFCRVHRTLGVTPAMAADVAPVAMKTTDIVTMIDATNPSPAALRTGGWPAATIPRGTHPPWPSVPLGLLRGKSLLATCHHPAAVRRIRKACDAILRYTGTRHSFSAYSRIDRSEENQPTCAVFSTLARHHAVRSRQRAATCAWAVT